MQKFYIAAFIFLYSSLIFAQNDTLQNDLINLKEVIVTATRAQKNLKNVPITVQVVTAEDIRKSQATNFQSFLETEFAGINFTYDGGMPNINMMGFGGKYVLFLIDGERMAGETFDNIDYNRINLEDIERIEIIKGASLSMARMHWEVLSISLLKMPKNLLKVTSAINMKLLKVTKLI